MFDPRWALRWIRPAALPGVSLRFNVVNKGICFQGDARRAEGFCVFESAQFDESFAERLRQRMASSPDGHFSLWVPDFLAERARTLLRSGLSRPIAIESGPFIAVRETEGGFEIRSRARVVNVDDSPVLLKFLDHVFSQMPFVDVIKQLSDSGNAAAEIAKLDPDLVTMDIQMPKKTGVDVVREIMSSSPRPVIMISSLSLEEGSLVFEALNAGAFDYLPKPRLEEKAPFTYELMAKLLAALPSGAVAPRAPVVRRSTPVTRLATDELLWLIGASTGGPQALTRVFTSLPAEIPPTVIVQHIPAVFSRAFAESLDQLCPFAVQEASDGVELRPNNVYVAAGGFQLGLKQRDHRLYLAVVDAPPVNRFKPSVDYLFHEAAKIRGRRIVAGILTGMGRDGAEGLAALKRLGARTFAQDEASCAVFGMPKAAIEAKAVEEICPLDTVPEAILRMSLRSSKI